MTNQQPACCLCGSPCEPWPTPEREGRIYGYGHDPDPLSIDPTERCCNDCNATKVIPARLGMIIAATPPTTDNRSNES